MSWSAFFSFFSPDTAIKHGAAHSHTNTLTHTSNSHAHTHTHTLQTHVGLTAHSLPPHTLTPHSHTASHAHLEFLHSGGGCGHGPGQSLSPSLSYTPCESCESLSCVSGHVFGGFEGGGGEDGLSHKVLARGTCNASPDTHPHTHTLCHSHAAHGEALRAKALTHVIGAGGLGGWGSGYIVYLTRAPEMLKRVKVMSNHVWAATIHLVVGSLDC